MSHINDNEMKELIVAWDDCIADVKDDMAELSEDEKAFLSTWVIVCHDAMEDIYHKHLMALKNARPEDHEKKWDCLDNIFIQVSYLKEQLEGAEGPVMKLWSAYNRKYPGGESS